MVGVAFIYFKYAGISRVVTPHIDILVEVRLPVTHDDQSFYRSPINRDIVQFDRFNHHIDAFAAYLLNCSIHIVIGITKEPEISISFTKQYLVRSGYAPVGCVDKYISGIIWVGGFCLVVCSILIERFFRNNGGRKGVVLFAVVLFASPGCGNCKFGTVEKIQIGIVGILLVYQITVTRYIANLHVADFYFFRHRIVLSQKHGYLRHHAGHIDACGCGCCREITFVSAAFRIVYGAQLRHSLSGRRSRLNLYLSQIGQRHIAGGQRAALPVESGAVDIRTLRHGIQFLRQFGRLVDDGGEIIYSRADSKIEQPAVVNVQRPVGSGIII